MTNLRSKSKAGATTPRAALKMQPTVSMPPTASDSPNLSEAALRKLSRSELQKLAMAHKVKANMKSELIIRQLLSLQIPKKTRPAENDPEDGPLRKRKKREAGSEEVVPENQAAPLDAQPTQGMSVQTSAEDSQPPEAGPSATRSISPLQKVPTILSYDKNLFSGTESEMTEEEQLDFATPVSSREETPPPANVNDLKRCVTIMQEISTQDVALLVDVTGVRETAARLRKRAGDLRDLVKAESGRRERMEAYFRYWQETEPKWDRQWLYGEKTEPDSKDSDKPAKPPTIPSNQRPATPTPRWKPTLSPEKLKKKREAIVSKQEAEQRQLEALQRRETCGENSSKEGSSEAASEHDLDGDNLPPTDENEVNNPLLISYGNSVGALGVRMGSS